MLTMKLLMVGAVKKRCVDVGEVSIIELDMARWNYARAQAQ